MNKTTKASRLLPGQTFQVVSITGERGPVRTLATKQAARASGYYVMTFADGSHTSMHGSTTCLLVAS